MKKEKKASKKVFKNRFASIMTCAIVGLGSAGLLAGCTSELIDPVWGKGDTLPTTAVIGELFYDTDDNMLFQYTEDGWVEVSEVKGETGEQGRSVEIQLNTSTNTYEWKYSDETTWKTLVDIDELKGATGDNVELQVNNQTKVIEWKLEGDNEWQTLIALSAITGDDGKNIELRPYEGFIQWSVKDSGVWTNLYQIPENGEDGREVVIEVIDGVISWKYDTEPATAWREVTALEEITGAEGKNIELRPYEGYIQWAVEGTNEWENLYQIPVNGEDGREVVIDVIEGVISWKYNTEEATAWREIKSISELVGEKGDTGATISSVEFVEDKWGIESKIVLTLNDQNQTVVESNVVTRVYENLYYTAESAKDVVDLMGYGVKYIRLGADVSFTEAWSPAHDVTLDLNGYTFNHLVEHNYDVLGEEHRMYVTGGIKVVFMNGEMNFGGAYSLIHGTIAVDTRSTLVLDNVNYTSEATAILPRGDAARVEVKDSTVVGAGYAIGTNATVDEQNNAIYRGVVVEVKESVITAANEYNDNTAILFNVPGTLLLDEVVATADRQAVIVRGGDAIIRNSKLVCTGACELKDYANWGNGNNLPMGALVIGNNNKGTYLWPTNLVLENNEYVSKKHNVKLIVANGIEGEEYKITVNMITDFSEFNVVGNNLPMQIAGNIELNFEVDSWEGLSTAYYASSFMKMLQIQTTVSLSQDVVVEEQELELNVHDFLQTVNTNGWEIVGDYIVYPEASTTLLEDVNAAIANIQTNIYNKVANTNGGQAQYITVADLDNATGWYVPVARGYNMPQISLTIDETTYYADSLVNVSIGKNVYVYDKAFYVEDGVIYLSAVVAGAELLVDGEIVVGGFEYEKTVELEYNTSAANYPVDVNPYMVSDNEEVTTTIDRQGYSEYLVTGNDNKARIVFDCGYNLTGAAIITRKHMQNKISGNFNVSYGFTDADVLTDMDNYALSFYPYYGQDLTNPELMTAYTNNTLTYTAYAVGVGGFTVEINYAFPNFPIYDVKEALAESLDEIANNLYNKIPNTNGGAAQYVTLEELLGNDYELSKFYVPFAYVGAIENTENLAVIVNDYDGEIAAEFMPNQTVNISVGNNVYVTCNAFKVENNELYFASPILSVELIDASHIAVLDLNYLDYQGVKQQMNYYMQAIENAKDQNEREQLYYEYMQYAQYIEPQMMQALKFDAEIENDVVDELQNVMFNVSSNSGTTFIQGQDVEGLGYVQYIVGADNTAIIKLNHDMADQNDRLVVTKQHWTQIATGYTSVAYGFTNLDGVDEMDNKVLRFMPYWGVDLTNPEMKAIYEGSLLSYTVYIQGVGMTQVVFGFVIEEPSILPEGDGVNTVHEISSAMDLDAIMNSENPVDQDDTIKLMGNIEIGNQMAYDMFMTFVDDGIVDLNDFEITKVEIETVEVEDFEGLGYALESLNPYT